MLAILPAVKLMINSHFNGIFRLVSPEIRFLFLNLGSIPYKVFLHFKSIYMQVLLFTFYFFFFFGKLLSISVCFYSGLDLCKPNISSVHFNFNDQLVTIRVWPVLQRNDTS